MKSKQRRAEENKTISISELTRLKFRVLKAADGMIEIVNWQDMGRVCALQVSDFKSLVDAQVYAQLLVLAPQLLAAYLSDTEKLEHVVRRFEKRMRVLKEHPQKR